MTTNIVELFGFDPSDRSRAASSARRNEQCPFIGDVCVKTLNDGLISGVCTLEPMTSGPVICCPNRLYADDYTVLNDVAEAAFGERVQLVAGVEASKTRQMGRKPRVAVFGKRWGGELHLPSRSAGKFYMDWILAKLNKDGSIQSFVAVEVQSIDTTGNYRAEREAYLNEDVYAGKSSAGFNWENVNKRILPQLIYKGHALRREKLCHKGLFFVCPEAVFNKIKERVGDKLLGYEMQPGAITFAPYDLGSRQKAGIVRPLIAAGTFTTTIDQLALAFSSPTNLPPKNVYQKAIENVLTAAG